MDNKAYQKMDYALCLLSAAADGKRHGCIVNSFHQVTSSFPPKFTVAVNKDHETCKAIQAAGSFSVTLLGADAPGEIIDLFGYKSGRVVDKFEGFDVQTDEAGNPYVKDHALARRLEGKEPINFPRETAIGALGLYVSNPSVTMFQPMNINFGIMPPLDHRVKGKRNKNAELSARSLAIIDQIKQEVREA